MPRKSFDPYPEVSDRSTDSPRPCHRRIMYGFAGDQCVGMSACERNESVQLRKIVLSIGIDLERMAETRRVREFETLHYRAAFALIGFESIYHHPIFGRV